MPWWPPADVQADGRCSGSCCCNCDSLVRQETDLCAPAGDRRSRTCAKCPHPDLAGVGSRRHRGPRHPDLGRGRHAPPSPDIPNCNASSEGRLACGVLVISPDLSFYPVTLIQLSTRGEIHNTAPIFVTKPVPVVGDLPSRKIPMFRFYFDGLIAHIHRQNADEHAHELGELVVGAGAEAKVVTVPYEKSFEKENLGHVIRESYGWPRAR